MVVSGLLVSVPYGAESPPGEPVTDEDIILAALGLYGMQKVKVYTFENADFSMAFSDVFDLYAPMDLRRHPVEMHAMAWHRNLQQAYDVTKQFNDLLALQGALLNNASQAVKYAKAYAAVANPELQGDWEVLDASDAATLNRSIVNPSARSLLDGWNVTLTTLQRQNGVLSNWTIVFTGNAVSRAEWEVVELLVGDYELDWEAVNLRVGTIVKNRYPITGYVLQAYRMVGGSLQSLLLPWQAEAEAPPVVSSAINFDGSEWQVRASGGASNLSVVLGAEAVTAYSWLADQNAVGPCQVANAAYNWGYSLRDIDCILELRVVPALSLLCGACLASGNETVVYVNEDIHEYLNELAYWNPIIYNLSSVAELIASHLMLVHLESETPEKLPDVFLPPAGNYFFFDNSTIHTEDFAIRAITHPAFMRVHDRAMGFQGYVATAPDIFGHKVIHIHFEGSPPPASEFSPLLPSGWTLNLLGDFALQSLPFVPESESGILEAGQDGAPGGYLIKKAAPALRCTASFVFKNSAGVEFIGTAGHCLNGAIELGLCPWCVIDGAAGTVVQYSFIGGEPIWMDAAAVNYDFQSDFALLTEKPLDPVALGYSLPFPIGGPHGLQDPAPLCGTGRAMPVGWYGNGHGTGETIATRARVGYLLPDCPNLLYGPLYFGLTNIGDSGSPVVTVKLGGILLGHKALLTVTHSGGIVFTGTPVVSTVPTFQGLENLQLVCSGGIVC